MKSKVLKIIAIFVVLLFIVCYACSEHHLEHHSNDLEMVKKSKDELITNAKVWYKNNKPESLGLRSADGAAMVPMLAEWSEVFATQNKFYEVVETDLMSQGRILYVDKDCAEKYNETKDAKYRQCYTRIVFR
ncbi:MAG: hypothetical protein FWD60_13915, partial [Candidatus Azobacteroides sp.]|nr:hypothetical protein [Candidatus Azobacteroides sp.]